MSTPPPAGSCKRIAVGNGPSAVAVTEGAVWVANFSDDTVTRIDPSTSAVVGGPIAVGDGPTAIAADANGAWVTSINDGLLTHVEPAGDSTSSIRVGNGPEGVAITTSGVWVTNSLDGTLSEIDTERMAIATTIPVGDGPTGITYGNASLWVANRYGGSIAKVDPRSAQADRIGVAGQPVASAFAGNDLWVATLASPTAHLGGVLKMASQYAPDTIDPATTYSPESWSILSMTNDGLVAFQRVGGPQGAAVVPDLATSIPQPSDGGKTYTFQLRPGIRYSDGMPVRAGDLRLALERTFAQGGGLAQYFTRIVGRGCVCEAARDLRPLGWRRGERLGRNGHHPSHGAGSRTAVRARAARSVRRARGHAEVSDHDDTDPGDGAIPHHVIHIGHARFHPTAAQPAVPGVVPSCEA